MKKNIRLLRRAAAEKADLICFPELCVPGDNRAEARLNAEAHPGESLRITSNLARESVLVIPIGMAEKSAFPWPAAKAFS